MKFRSIAGIFFGLLVIAVALMRVPRVVRAAAVPGGPYSSQPLALSWDDSQLAVVNPDANTVSIFQVQADQNYKTAEVTVGKEPSGVAFSSDGTRLYVANRVDGTVSVLSNYPSWNVTGTIPVGTEPFGMVLSASGKKLYVTNTMSNSVSVIDTSINQVTKTIPNVGPLPRGIAITHGASATDSNQVVYVTDFLALPSGNGHPDGFDDAKTGFVTAISVATDTTIGTIKLAPVADTGFKAAGDALNHIAPPASPGPSDFTFTTGAYPNQLNTIATHGNFAYVPNTAASPNGPIRFNVNEQSLVNVINLTTNQDAGQTINMQLAVGAQTNASKLFITVPWAIAFKNSADQAYVVSAASNIVVKLAVDPASGKPGVQMDPSDSTRVLEIPVGRNPRGIVINSGDTRAYVMNYVSRDVTVVDLTTSPEKVLATLVSTAPTQPGTLQDKIQIGKELFNTSVGVFDPPAAGQPAITGRMSNNGWGSCSACHPEGLTDNVVWIFAAGPRRTVPLHSTFAPGDPNQQRALNWSAIFDEVEDFEGNIRNVSGGLGLFVQSDGITQAAAVPAFIPASGGQPQLKVRGVGSWDAIKAYVQSGIRAPVSPASKQDPDVLAGRQLFIQNNCHSCHGTSLWTTSRVRYTPPPDPSLIQNTELIGELRQVGTFDSKALNEVRATAAAPLGPDGFNPPSLLSLFAFPQTFFHGGSAASLDAVLANVAHREAGIGGGDSLADPTARAQLVKFLLSIDGNSAPIDPKTPPGGSTAPVISLVANAEGESPTIAPNTWVEIKGVNLAPAGDSRAWQGSDFVNNQMPTRLDGVSATVNGKSAFVYYISPAQVNILTPPDAMQGPVQVEVANNGATSSAFTVQANPTSPSFFVFGGGPYVAAVHANGTLIGPTTLYPGATTPAKPGESVMLYANGFGPTSTPVVSGSIVQSGTLSPLPVITIGGITATVQFAGLVFPGQFQFNVVVPANAPDGDNALTATYNGVTTQSGVLLTLQH
jgi:uncharacterized protein (TIGR03437 family)